MTKSVFQKKIWKYYKEHGRHDLPWRNTKDPYKILVSEIMLQQTQVSRVVPKYEAFLKTFPTLSQLANASQSEVLSLWQGLGYNRRGLNLWRSAQVIQNELGGVFPSTPDALDALPGIGPYTACAVVTFWKNKPLVFIETNIRTVYLVSFFESAKGNVKDSQLLECVSKTVDATHPREWYYALMDYGVMLKTIHKEKNTKSAHYRKQKPFKGSLREIRSGVLKLLLQKKAITSALLEKTIPFPKEKIRLVAEALVKEGFIRKEGHVLSLIQ